MENSGPAKPQQSTSFKLSAILCFLLTLFFTTIVKDWRFFDDDYGAIYTATTTKGFYDLKKCFGPKHNDQTILPTNLLETHKTSFSKTTFRPLALVWYFLVSKVFNPHKPFHYFLFSIFLHVLATLLLFVAFLDLLNPVHAFFAALIFGVFPIAGQCLGRFVIQPYSLCLILNLLGYLCLQHYNVQNKFIASILSATCYLCSILLHEASYSYFLLYYVIFFTSRSKNQTSRTKAFWRASLDMLPFMIAFLSCAFAKYFIYQDPTVANISVTFFDKLRYRFYDFVTLVIDILGYSPIPEGNFLLKSSLLFTDIILLLLLFFFTGSFQVITLWGLFVAQCWPSLLIMHASRYLYFALPYLILALFIMYSGLQKSSLPEKFLQKVLQIKYLVILFMGLFSIRVNLLYLEKKFIFVDDTIKKFSNELVKTNNEADLYFAGLPFDYFPVSGLAQAIWFYTRSDRRRIFYDYLCAVHFSKLDFLPDKNFCRIQRYKKHRLLRMRLDKKTSAYISVTDPFGKCIPCSTGVINRMDSTKERCDCKSHDLEIRLFESLFPCKLVTWNQREKALHFIN